MGENMAKEMKVKLFQTIIKQDIAFYDKSRSGEIINRFETSILLYELILKEKNKYILIIKIN